MRILVVGANGMIGNEVYHYLNGQTDWSVFGTVRAISNSGLFSRSLMKNLIGNVELTNQDVLISTLEKVKPDVVINCAGLTKHKAEAEIPLEILPINGLFPHRLANLCDLVGARLIHISTDCVFSGEKGNYTEDDFADANDFYGRSKVFGEVQSNTHLTLRISTIGHELNTNYGLLEWFLSQKQKCDGFTKAIFSGFPTVVFAQILAEFVIPNKELTGLYHVASDPIAKYDLLNLIAQKYKKDIEIIPNENAVIDRSLNCQRFNCVTGYTPMSWSDMIDQMYDYDCWKSDTINIEQSDSIGKSLSNINASFFVENALRRSN